MARMHGRARGKSKSKKPHGKQGHSWVDMKPKELEMLIVKLAKEGKSPSRIGLMLRDSYGIPDVRPILKKRIAQVLEEKKVKRDLPEDLLALIGRAVAVRKHMDANRQDMTAKRGLQLTESKIKRLIKFYKANGKLADTWKYEPEKAGMYLE